MNVYRTMRAALFALEPETAHGLTIAALARGLGPKAPPPDPRLATRVAGLDLPGPLGVAAGFDKNAIAFRGALALGFGFVEVGTVTPQPQVGNPKPRVFRLTGDRAMINRLGFNNAGFDAVEERLKVRVGHRQDSTGIVGVNVGANRNSTDRVADYAEGVRRFARFADYITVNVSSPNTPGLRDLQSGGELEVLLAAVAEARASTARSIPIFVKIAPDLATRGELEAIVEGAVTHGLEGLILTNTTVARDGVTDGRTREPGGLSGVPLFERSTALLAEARHIAGDRLALIGVGGVNSPETAWSKLAAGADLIQLYTCMVFEGPGLPARIAQGLAARMERDGIGSIREIVGSDVDVWRAKATFGPA